MSTTCACPTQHWGDYSPAWRGLDEKRISRITLRLPEPLRLHLERTAHQWDVSMSEVIVHSLNNLDMGQAASSQTWSDTIGAAKCALDMLECDFENLTHLQRMWVLRRIHNVQGLLIGGNHEQA